MRFSFKGQVYSSNRPGFLWVVIGVAFKQIGLPEVWEE